MSKDQKAILTILGLTMAAFLAGIYIIHQLNGMPDQVELLFTSPQQRLAEIHFSGQQQSFTVTNRETLECFNRAFHGGRVDNTMGGITYDAEFKFESGLRAKTWIHVYDEDNGFSIAMQGRIHAGDPEYWGVRFVPPVPEDVSILLKKLRKTETRSP